MRYFYRKKLFYLVLVLGFFSVDKEYEHENRPIKTGLSTTKFLGSLESTLFTLRGAPPPSEINPDGSTPSTPDRC
jgi:hypothetical protein